MPCKRGREMDDAGGTGMTREIFEFFEFIGFKPLAAISLKCFPAES